MAEERELWGFGADDVNLVLSPLHHSAPLRFAVGTLLAGGRVVVPGPFDPARVTAAIVSERPTSMFCVPAHLQRLFTHWEEHGEPDLSCFRLVAHAGAPCPEWVKHRLVERFPAGSTWEFYGSTEGQFTACRSEEWLEHPGTLGRARPGRTMTVDDDGRLWCVVPPHARFSYFGDPEKTAEAWRETPDGPAFTVGDLGRIDADGHVFLDGRREDLIISGGVNVYPAEVERVLGEVEGVDDIAVFGVDDDSWGQRVCAAVVGTVDDDRLTAYAREHLAPAKRPKEYHRLGELPRTPTGKVRRLDLPDLAVRGSVMGFSRAELEAFRDVEVPDLLPGVEGQLRLLFVGINPGLWTAAVQTHFAHPGNRFYPALLRAGILAEPVDPSSGMTDADRAAFTARGLGITNLAPRATAKASELSAAELRAGGERLRVLVRERTPRVVAVAGITAYRQAFGQPRAVLGPQPEPFEGAELWVVPNPSGLNAHETVATLAEAYAAPARAAGILPS